MRAAILVFLLAANSAGADPSRKAALHLLAGYEPTATAADFVRLGQGIDRVLISIARDPTTTRLLRQRAMAALGTVPTEAGRAFLADVVRKQRGATSGADLIDLYTAVRAFGRFGLSAEPVLRSIRLHPSPDVRRAADDALAQIAQSHRQ